MNETAIKEKRSVLSMIEAEDSSAQDEIRLMLVDDHQVVRQGLRRILEMEDGITIIGEAGNGREAIRKARELEPDIVIMDLKMPDMDGIDATAEIKRTNPDIHILILTLYAEDYVKRAIEAGASGYLLKDCDIDQIILGIHQVLQGYCPIAPSLTRDLVMEYSRMSQTNRSSMLTRRQVEVIKLIADGLRSKEIASTLYISTSTVKREIRQILSRLDVTDRAQAVSAALKNNII